MKELFLINHLSTYTFKTYIGSINRFPYNYYDIISILSYLPKVFLFLATKALMVSTLNAVR